MRSQTKYSQQDIAEKLGIYRMTYANWENEKTEPSASHIPELVKIFGVTFDELFGAEIKTCQKCGE